MFVDKKKVAMKSILFFSSMILSLVLPKQLFGHDAKSWFSAISAGYVFKHDCSFKNVYGRGIVNMITVDGSYSPWNFWAIGTKISYWRAKGKTSFLKESSLLQEVPVTLYVRRIKEFQSALQIYASLGGGVVWVKEKSYLGEVRLHRGIAEVEAGLVYPIVRCINVISAFRYLFPSQSQSCNKKDLGGFDVRAGIGFSF
jgi:hypothetical protein